MTGLPGPPTAGSDAAGPASPGQLPAYPGRPAGSGRAPASPPGPPPGPPPGMAVWHRLHPLSPLVRSGRHLASFLTLLVVLIFLNARQAGHDFVSDLAVVLVVLVAGVISWAVTRWRVDGGVLLIETGLIRRQSLRFPLSQVQAIDVVQTGLARVLGLAEIRLRMAGADSSGGRLVALRRGDAQALRQQLLSISRGAPPAVLSSGAAASSGAASPTVLSSAAAASSGAAASPGATPATAAVPSRSAPPGPGAPAAPVTPADAQPERVVFRVQASRLAVALALSITGVIAAVVIAAVALLASLTPSSHSSAAAAFYLPVAVGVVLGAWRQFNGEYGTTIAVAPDGLRLRSGLVQRTAETIREGRVQAVRLVEPLVWRAFGWCRLEVDVAGPRQRRENRSESGRLRALVPVGTRAEAEKMLAELVSGAPVPSRKPPGRARWKAPLQYHFLAWDGDDRYLVAARGRIRRTTTWIPLEKVQSIRWEQGPVQRRLRLATVRLDVAGRRTTGSVQDRDMAEADDLLRRLPVLTRAARARVPHAPAS
ncbi:MAG: PH domain-containing protein [Streptosporangiaceae bacterium]